MVKGYQWFAGLAAACAVLPSPVSAAVVLPVEITYASGASFSGDVTFSDDYSQVLGVNGTLFGYALNQFGYNPTYSSAITWVWAGGYDFANGATNYGTYLMSGTNTSNYRYWVQFGYNFSNAPTLDFINNGQFRNTINGSDNFVSGMIGGVPEPTAWLLFILGFGAVGASLRRQRATTRQRVSYSFQPA